MAFLEAGLFFTAKEYEEDLPKRVHESEVCVDDLYVMPVLLRSKERQAAKLVCRTIGKFNRLGLTVIRFALLDKNLNSTCDAEARAVGGLFSSIPNIDVVSRISGKKFTVQQAYLKDYFEDQFGDLLTDKVE